MAASRESIAFVKKSFLSDSRIQLAPLQGRPYKNGQRDSAGRNRDHRQKKSPKRHIVGRQEELDDLIAAFDHTVHEERPNPHRVGCPGRPALTMLARESATLSSDSILEHIRNCAACLDDLKELRLAMKRSQ